MIVSQYYVIIKPCSLVGKNTREKCLGQTCNGMIVWSLKPKKNGINRSWNTFDFVYFRLFRQLTHMRREREFLFLKIEQWPHCLSFWVAIANTSHRPCLPDTTLVYFLSTDSLSRRHARRSLTLTHAYGPWCTHTNKGKGWLSSGTFSMVPTFPQKTGSIHEAGRG